MQTFLVRDDKAYTQAKFNDEKHFGLLRDALKTDQMWLQFVLYRGV